MSERPAEHTESPFADVVKRLRNGPHERELTDRDDMTYPAERSVFTYFPGWPQARIDEIWKNLQIPRRGASAASSCSGAGTIALCGRPTTCSAHLATAE